MSGRERRVGKDGHGLRVVDDVADLRGRDAEIYRHYHRADLRHGVVQLVEAVAVEGEHRHAVAAPDAETRRARSKGD